MEHAATLYEAYRLATRRGASVHLVDCGRDLIPHGTRNGRVQPKLNNGTIVIIPDEIDPELGYPQWIFTGPKMAKSITVEQCSEKEAEQ